MIDPIIQGLVGKQLGRYRLETLVAVGGMGVVFKGVHVDLGRPVAIKIVKPGVAIDESVLHRLMTEAQIAATLHHPGIAAVHDIGEDSGFHYMVIDYVAGSDLGALVEREGRLEIRQALQYVEAIAAALQYAHTLGVVHRDIKPSNVLLTADGRPVLTDFGIAKAAVGSKLTAAGAMLGTPEYMAPEQAQGHPADGRSDLYSLGVVFYEMISGHLPFEGDTPIATALKHITEQPAPVTRWLPDLPKVVHDFLQRAIAKNPDDRFQSGQEMSQAAAALRQSMQAKGIAGLRAHEAPVKHRRSAPGRSPGRISPRPQQPSDSDARVSQPSRPPAGATVLIEDRARRGGHQQAAQRSPISPLLMVGGFAGGLFLVVLLVAILRSATPVTPSPSTQPPSVSVPPQGNAAGVLDITTLPPGAEVIVGAAVRGITPARLELAPGSYTVEVRLAGYEPQSRDVSLRDGALEVLAFHLVSQTAQRPSAQTAELTVVVRPAPARFFVNGQYAGAGETTTLQLPGGKYLITARKQGFKDAEERVELTSGQARRAELLLTPLPEPVKPSPGPIASPPPEPVPPPIPAPPGGTGVEPRRTPTTPIQASPPAPQDTVPPGRAFARFPFLRRNAQRHPDGIMLQLVALKPAIRKGEALEFLVKLFNLTNEERRVSFPTAQLIDLYILNGGGEEVYRWSDGRGFSSRRQVTSWNPGANREARIAWTPPASLPLGEYRVYAVMLADARVETVLMFEIMGQ